MQFEIQYRFFPLPHVLNPNGAYNGQKLTKLVSKNTTPIAIAIKAVVPLMISVRYKIATPIAMSILNTRSAVPIFFFITVCY